MKHLSILLLLTLISLGTQAQEVYNLVLENATRTVNSPTSNFSQVQFAQFKRTALIYLKKKAFETRESVTEDFLNTQAYEMSEFLSVYTKQVVAASQVSKDACTKIIRAFTDASLQHPLFGDTDTDTTQSYLRDEQSLTPFSLDTDWPKAVETIATLVRKP